jgi:hypothetical protein
MNHSIRCLQEVPVASVDLSTRDTIAGPSGYKSHEDSPEVKTEPSAGDGRIVQDNPVTHVVDKLVLESESKKANAEAAKL